MICYGCYKASADDYCLVCRKRMFDGKKLPKILPFDAPKESNLASYQEQTKRLSISGVQLKYSLRLEGKELVLTEKNGHYILKPIPPTVYISETRQAPENEHLTMQIAEQVFKIKTAYNAVIYFMDGTPAYITRRFDVKPDDSKYLQEDMAQLSGRSRLTDGENFKYNGTIEEIGILVRRYVAAADPAVETLFRTVLFNYLLSNGDAHLKNFSLLQSDAGDYGPAPAYDLMNTILHMPSETDVALDLYDGDHQGAIYSKFGFLGQAEFRILAQKLDMIPKRTERVLSEMLMQEHKVINMIEHSFLRDDIKKTYRENFLGKLRRMGMTSEMIGRRINPEFPGVYAPTTRLVVLQFIDRSKKTGHFIETNSYASLEKENKFTFVESKNAIQYRASENEKLVTVIDGNELSDVSFLPGE
jgi:serine/threonine-protein kinase HipA